MRGHGANFSRASHLHQLPNVTTLVQFFPKCYTHETNITTPFNKFTFTFYSKCCIKNLHRDIVDYRYNTFCTTLTKQISNTNSHLFVKSLLHALTLKSDELCFMSCCKLHCTSWRYYNKPKFKFNPLPEELKNELPILLRIQLSSLMCTVSKA